MSFFVCCIASFNEPHFKDLIALRKKQLNKYNIPYLFLYDDPFPDNFKADEKDIFIPKLDLQDKPYNPPLNPHMIQRFIQLKKYIDLTKYDFIIRVNISTYINIGRLLNDIHSFPTHHFFGGHIFNFLMPLFEEYVNRPFTFVSGTFNLMSKDVFEYLANLDIHDKRFYQANDDVIISYILKDYINTFTHIPMAFVENDSMPPLNNSLIYRIKHYLYRYKEVNHWKFLLSKYDLLND